MKRHVNEAIHDSPDDATRSNKVTDEDNVSLPSSCECDTRNVSAKVHVRPCPVASKNFARVHALESRIHRDSIKDGLKSGLTAHEKALLRNICRDMLDDSSPPEGEDGKISTSLLTWLTEEQDQSTAMREIFEQYYSVCDSNLTGDIQHPANRESDIRMELPEEKRHIDCIIEVPGRSSASLKCKSINS